jgi:hypothetical protein
MPQQHGSVAVDIGHTGARDAKRGNRGHAKRGNRGHAKNAGEDEIKFSILRLLRCSFKNQQTVMRIQEDFFPCPARPAF